VLVLGVAEHSGLLPVPPGLPGFGPRIVMHVAAILAGTLVGRAVAGLLERHTAAADARERRFRTLLGIAAFAYWETDADLRLTQVSQRQPTGLFTPLAWADGHLPWALANLMAEPGTVARMREAMLAHAALRDLAFQGVPPEGGEPISGLLGRGARCHGRAPRPAGLGTLAGAADPGGVDEPRPDRPE